VIAEGFKPAHESGVLHYRIFDEMVIYRPSTSQAASLNESARAIWELCDGTRTMEEICLELAKPLGLQPAQLREDVWTGVGRLCDLGLLCREPG
jgi:hypothetical protein